MAEKLGEDEKWVKNVARKYVKTCYHEYIRGSWHAEIEWGIRRNPFHEPFAKAHKIINKLLKPKVKELLRAKMKYIDDPERDIYKEMKEEIYIYFKEVITPELEKECTLTAYYGSYIASILDNYVEDEEEELEEIINAESLEDIYETEESDFDDSESEEDSDSEEESESEEESDSEDKSEV